MKAPIRELIVLPGIGLMALAGVAAAQTFSTLHTFTGYADQGDPDAELILSGKTLYGTASGGFGAYGAVFAMNTDGTDFTSLHTFANTDGGNPEAGLILSGNILYGTTWYGGSYGNGTVFAVNTDGTGFTNLHHFTGDDGALPLARLLLAGNTLYGTASRGGNADVGTVVKLSTDGTGFTNLHIFTVRDPNGKNRDGAFPTGGLVLSGNLLYGTAQYGGTYGNGTVFALKIDGTGFTNLHNFNSGTDGSLPMGTLILSGTTLYGTAKNGGSYGNGTVFGLNIDGSGFVNLHSFSPTHGPAFTNGDGTNPRAGLVLLGNCLYGTASSGGGFLLGTAFSLSFTPQLTIMPSGPNVILSWPTNYAGFEYSGYILQSATNLTSPVWSTVLPGPVIVNGVYTVTNSISGTQQFYRLIK